MKKAKIILRTAIVALAAVLIALIVIRVLNKSDFSSRLFSGVKLPKDLGAVSEFALTDRSGAPVRLSDLKGKVWVADFIFTRCMGPCPLITTRMAELQNDFSSSADLRFVSFSVDPGYDTPAILSTYADRYGADRNRWYFLTGDEAEMHKLIRESFKLGVESEEGERSDAERQVIHSLQFVLVDRDGRIRGYFDSANQDDLKELRKAVKRLL